MKLKADVKNERVLAGALSVGDRKVIVSLGCFFSSLPMNSHSPPSLRSAIGGGEGNQGLCTMPALRKTLGEAVEVIALKCLHEKGECTQRSKLGSS